jgi:hypothetical protein
MSVPESGKRKRLLCRLNLHHKWVQGVDSDGQHYFRCTACGKDRRYDIDREDPHPGGTYFPTESG